MLEFLYAVNIWHWLVLAVILLGLEILVGTYDLLWLAAAAFITAIFHALPFPGVLSGWGADLVVFILAAVILLVMGRKIVRKIPAPPETHPDLNRRAESLIGEQGIAVTDFVAGKGRVKIGDTEWLARSNNGEILTAMVVEVSGAKSTELVVSQVK